MASVRPCTVALLVAAVVFLVAAASAQPLSPGVKPTDPILTNPDVIPIYMSPGSPPTVVSCYNHSDPVQDPECTVVARECPRGCRDACYVHCPSCKLVCLCDLTGTECYDPRFVGGDGNKFLFHGRKDADFCLLSDANLHINAHFIGKRNAAAARDFTWVQALGIRFGDHRLYLGVRRTVSAGVDMGAKIPVMGGAGKYIVSDIFATDCQVARFDGEDGDLASSVGMVDEPADVLCGSGKGSAGLVCKK
ncbi:hypothetical protein ABZP36_003390 [Zizania latifolia]